MQTKKSDLKLLFGFTWGETLMGMGTMPIVVALLTNVTVYEWMCFFMSLSLWGLGFWLYFNSSTFKNGSTSVKTWNTYLDVILGFFTLGFLLIKAIL